MASGNNRSAVMERELSALEEAEVEQLRRKWNDLTNRQEELYFREEQLREEGGPDFDSEEEAAEYEAHKVVARRLEDAQIQAIEERLSELEARMARPYEHWNEDERLTEYLERDRGDE